MGRLYNHSSDSLSLDDLIMVSKKLPNKNSLESSAITEGDLQNAPCCNIQEREIA